MLQRSRREFPVAVTSQPSCIVLLENLTVLHVQWYSYNNVRNTQQHLQCLVATKTKKSRCKHAAFNNLVPLSTTLQSVFHNDSYSRNLGPDAGRENMDWSGKSRGPLLPA